MLGSSGETSPPPFASVGRIRAQCQPGKAGGLADTGRGPAAGWGTVAVPGLASLVFYEQGRVFIKQGNFRLNSEDCFSFF